MYAIRSLKKSIVWDLWRRGKSHTTYTFLGSLPLDKNEKLSSTNILDSLHSIFCIATVISLYLFRSALFLTFFLVSTLFSFHVHKRFLFSTSYFFLTFHSVHSHCIISILYITSLQINMSKFILVVSLARLQSPGSQALLLSSRILTQFH